MKGAAPLAAGTANHTLVEHCLKFRLCRRQSGGVQAVELGSGRLPDCPDDVPDPMRRSSRRCGRHEAEAAGNCFSNSSTQPDEVAGGGEGGEEPEEEGEEDGDEEEVLPGGEERSTSA